MLRFAKELKKGILWWDLSSHVHYVGIWAQIKLAFWIKIVQINYSQI